MPAAPTPGLTTGYRGPMVTRARAAAAPAAFTGFPDEAMDFFEGLEAENSAATGTTTVSSTSGPCGGRCWP